jgi:hypothetical protein
MDRTVDMETLILVIALLVFPIVVIFGFSGCVGDEAQITQLQEQKKDLEDKLKDEQAKVGAAVDQDKKDEAAKEAKKYHNVVKAEPNLVSHWRLSEGEVGNAVAVDSAPDMPMDGEYKNLPGISRNVPGALALVADPADKSAEFDGAQGYVEVPYHLLLNPPLDFSIEVWINPMGTPAEAQVVVGSYDLDNGKVVRGYVLETEMSPAPLVRARVGFGSDATTIEASLGDGTEHGGWRHVVLTYENVAKQLKLYVNADNGIPDKEMGGTTGPPVFFVSNSNKPLRFAAGIGGAAGAASQFFKGRIDEVSLYRAALDGAKIRTHFLAGVSLPV